MLPVERGRPSDRYALKNWKALTRYLEDGDLSIDNNYTERSLRGIALYRAEGNLYANTDHWIERLTTSSASVTFI